MKKTIEIGSEFWERETLGRNELFFLSGRTSLDFIIRDILAERKIGVAHLPSFCCDTMIEPFLKNRVTIKFYNVFYENGILQADIPETDEDDIFFYINYFGYCKQNMGNLSLIKKSGCIIIEDSTHSWLVNTNDNQIPDYTFTSYRKWTGFTGISTAKKHHGKFIISPPLLYNAEYEMLRKTAQEKKHLYLQHHTGNKEDYLNDFAKAEEILDNDYVNYSPSCISVIDYFSLDKSFIANTRRENAAILLNKISKIKQIKPIFTEIEDTDVPLCVPILASREIRDELRKHLISQQIYCPIHWPISSLHGELCEKTLQLYKSELSLICDQRYTTDDMIRIADCIKSFFA